MDCHNWTNGYKRHNETVLKILFNICSWQLEQVQATEFTIYFTVFNRLFSMGFQSTLHLIIATLLHTTAHHFHTGPGWDSRPAGKWTLKEVAWRSRHVQVVLHPYEYTEGSIHGGTLKWMVISWNNLDQNLWFRRTPIYGNLHIIIYIIIIN
jgi:hypothetical protein